MSYGSKVWQLKKQSQEILKATKMDFWHKSALVSRILFKMKGYRKLWASETTSCIIFSRNNSSGMGTCKGCQIMGFLRRFCIRSPVAENVEDALPNRGFME